jgi:hypothetical protein
VTAKIEEKSNIEPCSVKELDKSGKQISVKEKGKKNKRINTARV